MSRSPPSSPNAMIAPDAARGPSEKPRFPPTEKNDIPLARLLPDT